MIFNSQSIWLLRYHVYLPQRPSSSAWCSPDLFTEYIGYSLSGFFVEPLHPPQLPSGLFYSSSKFSTLYTLNLYLWYSILLWNTESLCVCVCVCVCVHLIKSSSLGPRLHYLTRLLCPWDCPGKNTEVDCHFLLQGIFPTQGSNQHLNHSQFTTSSWHLRQNSYFPYPYI